MVTRTLKPAKKAITGDEPKRRIGRPRTVQPAVQPESSPDKLLDAAITLFAKHGYEAVSTRQVAEVAGFTQSMVHYHFSSKGKLWKAAINKLMRDRGSLLPMSLSELEDIDPMSRLKVLIRRFIIINAKHPELARIAVHEGMVRSPRLRWLISRYVGAAYGQFDKVINQAKAEGLIDDLPTDEVTNIIMISASIPFTLPAWTQVVYRSNLTDPAKVESYGNTLIRILFEGLRHR